MFRLDAIVGWVWPKRKKAHGHDKYVGGEMSTKIRSWSPSQKAGEVRDGCCL